MKPKVLVFFPQNPYPPTTGAHQRCLEMLSALIDLGCDVTLLSSTNFSETPWTQASIDWLRGQGVGAVHVYSPPRWQVRLRSLVAKLYWTINRRSGASPTVAVNSAWFSPPAMRRWLSAITTATAPNAVVMNYAYWDGLLADVWGQIGTHVIDTHDLVSLNTAMRRKLEPHLPQPLSLDHVPDDVLREDFFTRLNLEASLEEFAIYDRYDYTLAISPDEAAAISKHAPQTKVILAPMTQRQVSLDNTYAGAPLYAASGSPLNLQGYLYFVKRVLPRVLQDAPDFTLHVTGGIARMLPAEQVPGIVVRGFVPDLTAEYAASACAICPILGRTGQQVKIVEAMAHGLAVIALRATAEGSPIEYGVNGFIAEDADDFARYLLQLWRDRELCRKLGEAARATIAAKHSPSQLRDLLAGMLPA